MKCVHFYKWSALVWLLGLLVIGACTGPANPGPNDGGSQDEGKVSCKASTCQIGQSRCSGVAAYQNCESKNTGCNDWSNVIPCEQDQTCTNGKCTSKSCSDLCKPNALQCNGNGIQTCTQQSDGCFNWGTAKACPSGQTCQDAKCQVPAQGCQKETDCRDPKTPVCDTASKKCVGCIKDSDCPEPGKPACRQNTCQTRNAKCSKPQDCEATEFCFNSERCIKKVGTCKTPGDCENSEHCIQAGSTSICVPKCDPTQNKSESDLSNPQCWGGYGLCYSVSDTDPKDGACFPPQKKIRNKGENCNDEANPDKPSYHLCKAGLKCDGKTNKCVGGCKTNADCKDPKKPRCDQGSCVAKNPPTGCSSDKDCSDAKRPKCLVSSKKCVECLQNTDCKDAQRPTCQQNICQPKSTGSGKCQSKSDCKSGEFCFDSEQCLPAIKVCKAQKDCKTVEYCMQAGNRDICLPKCDPTKNVSKSNLSNPSCWKGYGSCYSVSDTDPKDGACYPPQRKKREHKETCNDEAYPDRPSYHLCKTGLTCVTDSGKQTCWKNCDPKKNVGKDPSKADKNPDCDGGKGTCHPLQGGGGACDPNSASTPPSGSVPVKGNIVINEALADPPTGAAGDANKDGTRSSTADEFVELVNVTGKDLKLDGVFLTEKGSSPKVLFTFGKGLVLKAGKAVVIFGGGMTSDKQVNTGKPHTKFGGALVYTVKASATRSTGLSLTNTGKTLVLKNASKVELNAFTYGGNCSGNKDQSVTRKPDGTGSCALHTSASPTKSKFSPGTRTNGKSF
mgnify:CR=1 FL=1